MKQKFTLFELNEQIKDTLCEAFPSTVWVVAEVSELKENRSGHCYLELVEKVDNEIIARSRATIWSYTYRMLKPYFETTTGQFFSHGIKVLIQVTVEFHSAYGLSLNIKDIDPTYTVGDMALQRKEIIARLKNEGIFDMNRELQLPLVPQKIAVISSKTAAGYQDFVHQLNSNAHGFIFYTQIFEAWMQGTGAVKSIIGALDRIYQYEDFFDAVAIIRGGGATADLSCFDNYELALNLVQFPLPVVTGIGHEKDDTIIDLIAHTRMKTPTAVAEFFINGVERFYDHLLDKEEEIIRRVREKLEQNHRQLERKAEILQQSVGYFIQDKNAVLTRNGNKLQQKVSRYSFNKNIELNQLNHQLDSAVSVCSVEIKNRLSTKHRILRRIARNSLLNQKTRLNQLESSVVKMTRQFFHKEKERLHMNENTVRLLNPENVLRRGYTLTLKEGKIVKSTQQIETGDEIETRFADGKVKSKITNKRIK